MTEKFVATVPRRIWAEGRPPRQRSWASEFNVASWVRLLALGGRVELLIRHFDEDGEHVTVVDGTHCAGQDSALLAGMVRLRFQGEVEQVQVSLRLSSAEMRYEVDELFMQRRDSTLARNEKLISNF